MSLLHTESFFAYGRYSGNDAFDAAPGAANEARVNHAANLRRGGYAVYLPLNTNADNSGGLVVRDDPVYPDRTALVHSSAVGAAVNLGVSAAFKKKLPNTGKSLIIGFSVFVPSDYVAAVSNSTVPVLRVNASADSDAAWYTDSAAKEAFRVTNDLQVRWGTEAAQGGTRLVPGQLNYLELRIDALATNVWINDSYVMQKTVTLVAESLAFIFENNANAAGTNMSGTPGRWAISNMYVLAVDTAAPFVRLGPSTRVIGQRADTDVDVDFIRPLGATTNAEVAGQDIVDLPPQVLQATGVGDSDTYAANTGTGNAAIAAMGLVHAVATKVIAANLEPVSHTVKPFLKSLDSAEGADLKPTPLIYGLESPTTRRIGAIGIRPTDNSIWIAAYGEGLFKSNANYDTSTWTAVKNTGSGKNYCALFMRSDGGILIGSLAGNHDWIAPGTNTPVLVGTGTASGAAAGYALSPDGTRLLAGQVQPSIVVVEHTPPAAASPQNGAWTFLNYSLTLGTNQIRSNGTLVMWTQASASLNIIASTSANAGTVAVRAHGDTSRLYSALTWDGAAWLIAATSNDAALGGAARIRRSTDGVTFSAVNPTPSGGVSQQFRYGASNTTTRASVFVGDAGAVALSLNGIDWTDLPRVTSQHLYAAAPIPNGFLIGGDNGVLVKLLIENTDTLLTPLSGFQMAFGSAALNPKTGAAWTPAEAAAAKFGVRLTS